MDSRKHQLRKSVGALRAPVATWTRGGRWPGGVPGKSLERLTEKPRPVSALARIQPNGPILAPSKIVQDLGLTLEQERAWADFLGKAVADAGNEVALRSTVLQRMREQGMDPALRAAMFQRTLSYARTRQFRKSLEVEVEIVDPGELRKSGTPAGARAGAPRRLVITEDGLAKAQARGGRYHRRVPTAKGGWRYYYDAGEYEKRPDAHASGNETREQYMGGKVAGLVEAAGPKGLAVGDLRELAKKFGKSELAAHLKSSCAAGKLKFKKGRLYKGKA